MGDDPKISMKLIEALQQASIDDEPLQGLQVDPAMLEDRPNLDQYTGPSERRPDSLDWRFRPNLRFFSERMLDTLDTCREPIVINTPTGQTVITPISDSCNNLWVAGYAERFHDIASERMLSQSNGLALMFKADGDNSIGLTGGVRNIMIPDDEGRLGNSTQPFLSLSFQF